MKVFMRIFSLENSSISGTDDGGSRSRSFSHGLWGPYSSSYSAVEADGYVSSYSTSGNHIHGCEGPLRRSVSRSRHER